jgi:hypothetical protein
VRHDAGELVKPIAFALERLLTLFEFRNVTALRDE